MENETSLLKSNDLYKKLDKAFVDFMCENKPLNSGLLFVSIITGFIHFISKNIYELSINSNVPFHLIVSSFCEDVHNLTNIYKKEYEERLEKENSNEE